MTTFSNFNLSYFFSFTMLCFGIQIHSIKGIPTDITNKYAQKGLLFVRTQLGKQHKDIPRKKWGTWGNTVKHDEIFWSKKEGTLKWEISSSDLSNIKAIRSKLKLIVSIYYDRKTVDVGWIVVDLRDELKRSQFFKVYNMPGAELQVSTFVIPVTSSESRYRLLPRFSISISLQNYRNLIKLIPSGIVESNRPETGVLPQTFWLAYTFLGESFTTERISLEKLRVGPSSIHDVLRIPTEFPDLLKLLHKEQSLKIFFLTTGEILAKAELSLDIPQLRYPPNSIYQENLPIQIVRWATLYMPGELPKETVDEETLPGVQVILEIQEDFSSSTASSQIETTTSSQPTVRFADMEATAEGGNRTRGDDEDDGDGYEDEGFEDDRDQDQEQNQLQNQSEGISENKSNPEPLAAQHTNDGDRGDDDYDNENFDEGRDDTHILTTSTPTTEITASRSKELISKRRSISKKRTNQSDDDDREGEGEDQGEDEDNEWDMKHYRLSTEVRYVSDLKTAAHLSIQYSYPHIGLGSHVRTQPHWVLPHVAETRIDGATAIFECAMSHENISNIFKNHPLAISILKRSNLGAEEYGLTIVDLFILSQMKEISYRCPLTSKTFKTKLEYKEYRKTMLRLKAAGKLIGQKIPPRDCVCIRAWDVVLPILPVTNVHSSSDIPLAADKNRPEIGKIRFIGILEDMGSLGTGLVWPVKYGYKMHGGGVYERTNRAMTQKTGLEGTVGDSSEYLPSDPTLRENLTPTQRAELEVLKLDWEGWRRNAEAQWRESLREKENQLRKRLEAEAAASLAERADDLRRAHEEAAKLEVRLRSSIDAVERQKAQLVLKEEQITMKLAQRTAELQLLQRRIREEAKTKVEVEERKVQALEIQLRAMQETVERAEKRAREAEKEYDHCRQQTRQSPETHLKEEIARVRAQLAESRLEVERERRLRGEMELEKEHFRTQVHRFALALKREREKNSVLARQELEQLRLEFLAREERYVLDGDREELRNIRNELSSLRSASYTQVTQQTVTSQVITNNSREEGGRMGELSSSSRHEKLMRLQTQKKELLATGLYNEHSDLVLIELNKAIAEVSNS